MGQETNPGGGGLAGETPDSLSLLQILIAHLYVAGVALFLTAHYAPELVLSRVLMVVLAGACLVIALFKLFPPSELRPHEWTSLAVVFLLSALLAAAGFGILSL